MPSDRDWVPVEPDLETILAKYSRPMNDLAAGRIPAVLLRQAFNPEHCAELVKRFYERGLLYDPRSPGSDESVRRVDIGTSLGTHGRNPAVFFHLDTAVLPPKRRHGIQAAKMCSNAGPRVYH